MHLAGELVERGGKLRERKLEQRGERRGRAAAGNRRIDRARDRALVRSCAPVQEHGRDRVRVEHEVDVVGVVFDARLGDAEVAGNREVAERAVHAAGRVEDRVARADRVARRRSRSPAACRRASRCRVTLVRSAAAWRDLDDVVAGADEGEVAADGDGADRVARRERAAGVDVVLATVPVPPSVAPLLTVTALDRRSSRSPAACRR